MSDSHGLKDVPGFGVWILICFLLFFMNACVGFEKKMVSHPKKKMIATHRYPPPHDHDLKYFYPPETDYDYFYEGDDETDPDCPLSYSEQPEIPDDWDFLMSYFEEHGLCLDGSENEQLLSELLRWIGTPYRIGGCSVDGIDCSCFVRTIYRDVYVIELNRTSESIFLKDASPIEKDDLQEGDIICFVTRKKRISHIALFIKDDLFIHASRSKGVVINSLNDPYYQKTFYSAGRIKDRNRYSVKR
jgi:hypothetical protein